MFFEIKINGAKRRKDRIMNESQEEVTVKKPEDEKPTWKQILELITNCIIGMAVIFGVMYGIAIVFNKAVDYKVQVMRNEIITDINECFKSRDKYLSEHARAGNSNVKIVDQKFDNMQKQINDLWKRRNQDVEENNHSIGIIDKDIAAVWKFIEDDNKIYDEHQNKIFSKLGDLTLAQSKTDERAMAMKADVNFHGRMIDLHQKRIWELQAYQNWLEGKFFGAFEMPKELERPKGYGGEKDERK